ncbi:Fe-S cluster assembly sulfur transfer protein SufU [Pseudobacteriovorax antillogorgiicola]|uniref:Nitrogen fixation protein NifU n=1 Tax=Pseudobacteriovorax antillogorgiicola TaxID=1513793 RepID=A0A1Y6C7K9_9BACT|nr:SUF system NifU family Fe-S cluster assembly protein [Pseudobacteriovorax antillogorgiicola]TCS49383.1 nitrogen fixation NifU-like protein [Pseudobacteriovorax antillogorgiicola]SMF47279.1 nitrogen fixation protein NifU [Pseudobacteriovorax antillogorgiicola]
MVSEEHNNDLYQKVLLEHARQPRNFGEDAEAQLRAEGRNKLCGDTIRVYLRLSEKDRVEKASFDGESCAICKGTASLLTTELTGKTRDEAKQMIEDLDRFASEWSLPEHLGAFKPLQALKKFPTRLKCLTLPWRTFQSALLGNQETVSTE